MTSDQLKQLGYEERNGEWHKANSPLPSPKLEPIVCHEPVEEAKGKKVDSGRVRIRVTSFRTRLCDPDNLCPKYFIDCLRYSGLIQNDTPDLITLEVSQEKVKKNQERTEIEIL